MHALRSIVILLFCSLFLLNEIHAIQSGADVESLSLSEWHCIGPFKDEAFGNIDRSLEHVFLPERDYFNALENNSQPIDPGKTFWMKPFPGYQDLERRWENKNEWKDGFYNLLPRGPAPSRNETVYLYRTINSKDGLAITIHLRLQDFYKVWINGQLITRFNHLTKFSRYNYPAKIDIPLKKGKNHLLIKNVSRWAEHGFSFGIEGMHQIEDKHFLDVNNFNVNSLKGAEEYIRCFKFRAVPIPMHSPAEYQLDIELNKLKASAGAQIYLTKLKSLEAETGKIIEQMNSGTLGESEILTHAKKLQSFLKKEVEKLPLILFIRKPLHYQNAIAPYDTDGSSPSEICLYDPSSQETEPKVIFSQKEMRIHSMNLSFDAKTIFFSGKIGNNDQNWHIYKVGIDGKDLKQLTSGTSKNISPCELPNGRIAYVSTQKNTFVECQTRGAGLLYTMNADGTDIRIISANIDSDHTPQVSNDGRILFTRWDYGVEKNVFARHGLWTVNPDGTNLQLIYGNTVEDPGGMWNAQPIPGRPELLTVFGPHHTHQAGMIGLVWNWKSPEAPRGIGYRWITREVPIYGDLTYPDGYQNPYPLNEKQFIVCYGGKNHRPEYKNIKGKRRPYTTYSPLKILYLDAFGNEQIIYTAKDSLSCYNTIFLREREKPTVIADKVPPYRFDNLDPEEMNRIDHGNDLTATMLVQDVYKGISRYVKHGEAKYIAVMEQVQKSRKMIGGEAWGHTPIIGRGTVHARRLIGLVPIEEDGSAFFKVRALRSVSLNVLDKDGKTLMRMGSDMHVMPEEQVSCIGCHEVREYGYGAAPMMTKAPIAMKKAPVTPQKQGWGTKGLIDYVSVVQPVWDKHCISCHSGAKPKGNVNMSGDKTRFFNQSYDHLIDRDIVDHLSVFSLDHDEGTPNTSGAKISSIDKYMSRKHCKSDLSWAERFAVYCWIDANVPYYGTYEYNLMRTGGVRGIGARDGWESKSSKTTWAQGDLQEMFDRRCASCHEREVLNQSWLQPMRMKVYSNEWGDKALTSHGFGSNKWKLVNKLGPEYRINLSHPSYSLFLQAPLDSTAGGLGLCRNMDGSSVFRDKKDADYQKALKAINIGKDRLHKNPRIDMLGKAGFTSSNLFCIPNQPYQETNTTNFVVSSHNPDAISVISEEGIIQWQYTDIIHPQDIDITEDGKVFCSQKTGAKLITMGHAVLWEYKVPKGTENPVAQVLSNDRFLVGNEGPGQLLEINAKNELLKTIQLSPESKRTHGQFRFCIKTGQGTYLAPFIKDGRVKEYTENGKVVKDFGTFDRPVSAIRLKNGNTLIGSYRRLDAFDINGNLLWSLNPVKDAQLKGADKGGHVTGITELTDGSIAFAFYHTIKDWPDVIVIDKNNKITNQIKIEQLDKIASIKGFITKNE